MKILNMLLSLLIFKLVQKKQIKRLKVRAKLLGFDVLCFNLLFPISERVDYLRIIKKYFQISKKNCGRVY